MEAFVWDPHFVTGIATVDEQHHRLVDIINQLGNTLIIGKPDASATQAVFHELAEYARFHFADEERVMVEAGIDARHLDEHRSHHRGFVEQLVTMWQGRDAMERPAEMLHGFLSAWLSFHILGEDLSMARQVSAIAAGKTPAEALAQEAAPIDSATSALLMAMGNLYHVLSLQNRDLANANRHLEDKVTARTRELVEAQNQLLQSEKMASIGQLAAGVAHEINNPIGFVNSNLGTLSRYVEDILRVIDARAETPASQALSGEIDVNFLRADLVDLVRESREGLERVRKIVANLKDFSHVDEAEWQDADLLAGLDSTLNVVWHELKYKVELVRQLAPLPRIRCIPAQLNQVFMNLLVNAAQAIKQKGTITLSSGVDGDQVWIEIADTGVGMDDAVIRRMFDPFFTTKPVGTGTGLGLSLSYDIIKKHGGRFDVSSTPGVGTTIRLYLPVSGPANETAS